MIPSHRIFGRLFRRCSSDKDESPGLFLYVTFGLATGIISVQSCPPFLDHDWLSLYARWPPTHSELTAGLPEMRLAVNATPSTDRCGTGTNCSGRCQRRKDINLYENAVVALVLGTMTSAVCQQGSSFSTGRRFSSEK